jgi:hypothetical protein
MKWRAFTLFALVILWATPALAGWVIEEKSEEENSTLYFQNNMMRQESSGHVMILDLKKRWLTFVNPVRKVYWAGPASEMQKIQAEARGKMESAMAQMQEQMKKQMEGLPPAQRQAIMDAMRKQMQGKQGGAEGAKRKLKVEVKRTNETATIAGHKARKREVWVDGELREELWIAKGVNVGKEIDVDKMSKVMRAFGAGDGEMDHESSPKVMALWKEGYPLRQVEVEGGERQITEVVKAVQKRLAASSFQVPAGYRKVGSMMEVMQ